ncbi:MAG: DUF1761 family protein [Saprospiraceae bacterium]|nr:DUF1761 family protein [Saprospiraceae bacterium]MBK7809702.1 DUF1761 family protein [Saprospiraceae bacterium]MBK9632188.1 DUF1761 family protein [Saprospiraceae bacterium]
MEKKILIGTLVGTVVQFCLGGLVFVVLLKDMMAEWMTAFQGCAHAEPPMLPVVLAQLVISLLLAILMHRNAISTFKGGAMFGLLFFLLIYIWFDLWMFASFTGMTSKLMMIDAISNTIIGTITAGFVGWVYGKMG